MVGVRWEGGGRGGTGGMEGYGDGVRGWRAAMGMACGDGGRAAACGDLLAVEARRLTSGPGYAAGTPE